MIQTFLPFFYSYKELRVGVSAGNEAKLMGGEEIVVNKMVAQGFFYNFLKYFTGDRCERDWTIVRWIAFTSFLLLYWSDFGLLPFRWQFAELDRHVE